MIKIHPFICKAFNIDFPEKSKFILNLTLDGIPFVQMRDKWNSVDRYKYFKYNIDTTNYNDNGDKLTFEIGLFFISDNEIPMYEKPPYSYIYQKIPPLVPGDISLYLAGFDCTYDAWINNRIFREDRNKTFDASNYSYNKYYR